MSSVMLCRGDDLLHPVDVGRECRNDDPSAPLIEQMDFSQYHLENIGEKAKILNNFKSLFFLMIFISLSVIALRIWYKLCGRFFSEIKSNLSENYFFKSVISFFN